MTLKRYGVLVGRAIDRRLGTGDNPHYQIHLVDEQNEHRIAMNVQSALAPSELEYLVVDRFLHPVTARLAELADGFHPLASTPDSGALDFIRGNLFDPREMRPLPFNVPGPDNDLNEKIDHYVQRAMGDEDARLFAFGEAFGPEAKRDKIFGFKPGSGIHDIHMNQSNVGTYTRDDGVWQDGALILHFPRENQWVGVFLKFQSQGWHTDDRTGHAIGEPAGGPPSDATEVQPPLTPVSLPTAARPDGLVRIVAAQVNSRESPEVETVTLLNAGPEPLPLAGWAIADSAKRKFKLAGVIESGAALRVRLDASVALSNKGGIITLLNAEGLKVDGVSYTRDQARNPGWTIVF